MLLIIPRMELALLIFAAMCLSKLWSWSIMTPISFSCSVLCSGARSFLKYYLIAVSGIFSCVYTCLVGVLIVLGLSSVVLFLCLLGAVHSRLWCV